MLSETLKPNQSTSETEKHKQLNMEMKDMVSSITNRISDIHKLSGGSHHHHEEEDEHGIRVITLTGTNTGATLRSELDEKSVETTQLDETDGFKTYVNSNFQAVNNSIMMGGSYNTNDPGVHLDISDFAEVPHGHKKEKRGRKGKNKKDRESSSKSDHQYSEHAD